MVLILNESDVNELVDMKSAISCLESAFREQSEKRFLLPERQFFKAADNAVVRIMAASIPELNSLGLKVLLGVPAKRAANATYFVVLLLNPDDARLLAVISAGRLTQLRTGAASAVATNYLARSGILSVGVLGAGVQGYGQLEGIHAVAKLKEALVFDIDPSRAEALTKKATDELGVIVRPAHQMEELYATDVISTATTSVRPLIFGEKLCAGTHVNAVGSNAPNRQEIDHSVLLKSRVFTDKTEQVLKEGGDLVIPISQGIYRPENIVGELADVVTGKIKGRTSNSDVTLFKSVGIALEDMAVARTVYELAIRKGVGREIAF
jgi:ornithine cyclodeaminase/alanine dehydrogenase-like protein (mu-crystallin family)